MQCIPAADAAFLPTERVERITAPYSLEFCDLQKNFYSLNHNGTCIYFNYLP